jgi:CheY-like chemotaxis protein
VKGFRTVAVEDIEGPSARAMVRIAPDESVPAWILRRAFGDRRDEGGVLVEVQARGRSHAIVVDGVESDEEVVIRPVPGVCGVAGLFDGLALTAAGMPVALLSVDAIDSEGSALQAASIDDDGAADRRIRVLLVDDSSVTRAMIRRILEDAGFDVVPSAGGEEAWARLQTERFDCLVTDIEMPDVDGLELARRVRSHPGLEELPIVVVSTRSRAKDRLQGLDAGADSYLTKQNLDTRELVELVRRAGAGR